MTAAVEAPAAFRNRIVGTGEEAPDQLLANPKNWRVHPSAQEAALESVLSGVGWVGTVLVNRTTGHVVDGHLRVALALKRGEPTVPVTYVELTEDEEALALASFDPIGAMAGTDEEKLRSLLDEVTIDSDELEEHLVSFLARGKRLGLTDPDAVPEPPAEPYVKAGDLWVLAEHRLIVGDCRDPDVVARLLDGAEPTLLVTDPPYGVSLDPTWRDGLYNAMGPAAKPYMQKPGHAWPSTPPNPDGIRKQGRAGPGTKPYMRGEGHRNTSLSGDTIVDWSEAFELVPSLTVGYVWHAGVHAVAVAAGLERIGFEIVSQVVWDKGLFAMSRGWYHWAHEPCWVVRKKGAKFLGKRNQATVWRVPQRLEQHNHPTVCCEHQATIWSAPSPKMIMSGSREEKFDHPAQKPVVLYDIPILNHDGDVYDPFAGCGTSIIAAEQQRRRAFAIEIDPRFAQIAIERWQAFTGLEASRG